MTVGEIRAALDVLQLQPSKKLGQNFLSDEGVAKAIVDLLGIGDGESVCEIGPGLGALTEHLVGRVTPLILIEKDKRLASHLRAMTATGEGVDIVEADAVGYDIRPFFAHRPFKVIGNLPYSAGTEILRTFLGDPSPLARAVFMLQKEVAERLVAVPRTKAYGVLTLRTQSRWTVRIEMTVPPDAFWPRPQVDSSVIVVEPRAPGALPVFDRPLFDRLVRQGFSQRRKQLRKLLPPPPEGAWEDVARAVGTETSTRAEELTLEQWVALARLYDGHTTRGQEGQREDEVFDVVDETDSVVGQETRANVHRDGLLHRAVHIFVRNKVGDIYLQKRSHLKDVFPGRWDSSAAGHLDAGEGYRDAAVRELAEELGLDGGGEPGLEEVGGISACPNTGNEFVRLYSTTANGKIRTPANEVETGSFFPVDVIDRWVDHAPDDFATGFLECWSTFKDSC